ncbi:hypothetical protein NDI37_11880 [Funiculus sociatus GB2-A5]|jgi:hypothetical protein|uniref:Uncharacterized protein n=1 Tax=Funiculus sociatus GB2-A5 TaxID=2933946 RepID=A0ABV0JNY4_9CYAN|nr:MULTISPECIES: hypothetical protein [unclassified Trichocoleus]MBD1908197.1 hypothetical protein [Trichocoleus sp. FACHB-832]MBD2061793.1 hypothetical protein [Trichocoleus sp. FACHB-6]
MQAQEHLTSGSIGQLVEHLLITRTITRADQRRLMSTLLSKTALNAEEQAQVNRVLDKLKNGWLRVVE